MASIIEINNDEIFENFDKVLESNSFFVLKDQIKEVNVFLFYCENDEILNYKKYEVSVNANKLTKKELLTIILNNNKYYNKKYDLIGIYKYCFNLQPEQLKSFCDNPMDSDFMSSYTKVQDIEFEPCIESFQHNSSVILIFNKQKQTRGRKSSQSQPSKIESGSGSSSGKNKTQKHVRFDIETRNKTIKKRA
jgi:hypothetical protein